MYRASNLWDSFVERFIVQCPCYGGATIRGSTVICGLQVLRHQVLIDARRGSYALE